MDQRARLTPVDVAYIAIAVFILGILVGPIYSLLNGNAGALGTGDIYMFRIVVPGALIAIFVTIMATAVEGR